MIKRPGTVNVIVVDQNNRILIVRSRWRRRWEYPGGSMRSFTSVNDAASSELYEKTGLTLGAVDSIRIDENTSRCVFVISYEYNGNIWLDRSVYTDYRWVYLGEASALLSPVLYDYAEQFTDLE